MNLRLKQRERRWAMREMARLDARRDSLRDQDGAAIEADGSRTGRRPPSPAEEGRG